MAVPSRGLAFEGVLKMLPGDVPVVPIELVAGAPRGLGVLPAAPVFPKRFEAGAVAVVFPKILVAGAVVFPKIFVAGAGAVAVAVAVALPKILVVLVAGAAGVVVPKRLGVVAGVVLVVLPVVPKLAKGLLGCAVLELLKRLEAGVVLGAVVVPVVPSVPKGDGGAVAPKVREFCEFAGDPKVGVVLPKMLEVDGVGWPNKLVWPVAKVLPVGGELEAA